MSRVSTGWAAVALLAFIGNAPFVEAQEITNPAAQRPASADSTLSAPHRIVWEMPPVLVRGKRPSHLREEQRVGSYGQPRWTAHRRFTTTRVYVVPRGSFEFEYWLLPTFDRKGAVENEVQYETELGLPGRMQLDLYAVSHKEGREGPMSFDEQKVELRWALADWDVIPANPTLYLEWIGVASAPDHLEGKLLLGDELATGWHWGVNLVLEHEMGGAQENSNEVTLGVSRTLADGLLSLGAETKLAFIDVGGARGKFIAREYQVGPSIQYWFMPRAHLDVVPLVGVSPAVPNTRVMMVVGWEF
jgi:hypothetical protein